MRVYFLTFIPFLFLSCKSNIESLTNNDLNFRNLFWHHSVRTKNFKNGTELKTLYLNEKYLKTSNSILVAVLDSQIDLDHEDLKSQIWVNDKEIPYNKIDDDKNGYIDDVNGWNFVGKPSGETFKYSNFDCTRIIRDRNKYFEYNMLWSRDSTFLQLEYNRAKAFHETEIENYSASKKIIDFRIKNNKIIQDSIEFYFPFDSYNLIKLDSFFQKHKTNNKSYLQRIKDNDLDIASLICYKMGDLKSNISDVSLLKILNSQYDSIINRNLNVFFDDRKFLEHDRINYYGNSTLDNDSDLNYHSTLVASIIAGNRNNNIGVNGFHDNIKVMPLSISVSGDEHDKDIAMAIRYAVDNGAKIINMSFGKEFSLNQQWVTSAFEYAEQHNVLLVHSSGNNSFNVDSNRYYPSDYDYYNKKELVGNFINVGSISKRTDSTMVSPFSNYGKENVDIFAPGEDIYVAKPNNEYGYDSGTSLAGPMVSGTAALIWLYYPKLTVKQIKDIILESGITIDKMVVKPGTENQLVPFSDLSKTGKVLNTYKAFLLAKKISKKK